jgi:hypothetical protein
MVSFVALEDHVDPTYAPNFDFSGEFINDTHATIHEQVRDIPGWLEPEDSLKLYELAYFSTGPIVEIGTYCGKSTTIIASALCDAASAVSFLSLDIDADALTRAHDTLVEHDVRRHVELVRGSIDALFAARPELEPSFVFMDGDHTFQGASHDIGVLKAHVPENGLLLFHDYLNTGYGIANAVKSSWVPSDCVFAGAFGCAALYRRSSRRTTDAPGPKFVDLSRLAPWNVRLRSSVLMPLAAKVGVRRLRSRLRNEGGRPA